MADQMSYTQEYNERRNRQKKSSNYKKKKNLSSESTCSDESDWDDCQSSSDGLSIENLEAQLIVCIDRTSEKNAKTRVDALKKLRTILANNMMFNFVQNRRDTFADVVKRCLRKGKSDEQENAVALASILFLTLGSTSDTDVVFEDLHPLLTSSLNDESVAANCREQCALALAIGCFIAPIGIDYMKAIMEQLYSIFACSFPNGEGVHPTLSASKISLHNCALNAWCLLITLLSADKVITIAELHLEKIVTLLENADQDLRLSAGECISLIHEIAREYEPDFEMKSFDELSEKLHQIATHSHKFRSKRGSRVERSNFRDIMRTVVDNQSPSFSVRRKDEKIELDCWSKKIQYDVFCTILESGCQIHLAANQLLRDILELGSLPINSRENRKVRKMDALAADKARSKFMREVQALKFENDAMKYKEFYFVDNENMQTLEN